MYLTIVRNLALRYLCFFKKAITTVSMFSTSFYSQFWTGSSVCFVYCYYFSLNIFRLEATNPKKNSSVFKRLPKCKWETFSRRHCPRNPGSQTSIPAFFQLSLHEKRYAQTNPWIRHWRQLKSVSASKHNNFMRTINYLTLPYIMLKKGQPYLKNLVVWTPQKKF